MRAGRKASRDRMVSDGWAMGVIPEVPIIEECLNSR